MAGRPLFRRLFLKFKKSFKILGPGLITGAADDDPSGIATCAQTGAQFGYAQLWTVFCMLPLMISVQEACGRIGAQKGQGLIHVIRKNYNKHILYFVILLLFIANTINIGADLGAMAEAACLIVDCNFTLALMVFVVFILTAQVFIGYKKYATILKFLCLSLLAYPITVFVVNAPLAEILKATVIPQIEWNYKFLFLITALLGTTISPYMFFWQCSEQSEEDHEKHLVSKKGKTRIKISDMFKIRLDTILGMLFSQITSWSIIVVAATVLSSHHINEIKNAADVAKMLEPLVQNFPNSGYVAKLIFSVGIIGLGLLAIPVLSGSLAYAICEVFDWKRGMNLKFKTAKKFYGTMFLSTIIGVLINYIGINTMKALVYAAVVNGVLAVPLVLMIALIARSKKIMGKYKSGLLSEVFVWTTFFGMLVSAVAMFFS